MEMKDFYTREVSNTGKRVPYIVQTVLCRTSTLLSEESTLTPFAGRI